MFECYELEEQLERIPDGGLQKVFMSETMQLKPYIEYIDCGQGTSQRSGANPTNTDETRRRLGGRVDGDRIGRQDR